MNFLFFGFVFILMGVTSPTILSLGVLLLSLMLSMSLLTVFTSWFSFVLVLLYIGGMMVIIMYFSTLVPNQDMGLSKESYMGLTCLLLFLGLLFMKEEESKGVSGGSMDSLILYESGSVYLSVGLLIFLFVLMVLVVVVTSFFGAPLRPLK